MLEEPLIYTLFCREKNGLSRIKVKTSDFSKLGLSAFLKNEMIIFVNTVLGHNYWD